MAPLHVTGTTFGGVIIASPQPMRHPTSLPVSIGPPPSPLSGTDMSMPPPSSPEASMKPLLLLLPLPHAATVTPAPASTAATAIPKPMCIRCMSFIPPSAPGHRVAERRRMPVEVVEDHRRVEDPVVLVEDHP